jgi:adenylate kinase
MIVAITGCGGTGKTVTAKILAKRIKWKLIRPDDIAKKKKLYLGYDKKRKSWIVNLTKLKKEIKKSERENKNIIIESLYSHFLPAHIIIVLRTKPDVLLKRLKKKYKWKTKITENYEAELIGLITSEIPKNKKVYEIDTTNNSATQTAKKIERIIKGRINKYKVGKIEWLKCLPIILHSFN